MAKLSGLSGWQKVVVIIGTAGTVSGVLGGSAVAIATQIFPTPMIGAQGKTHKELPYNGSLGALKRTLTKLINVRAGEMNDNIDSIHKLLVDELRPLKMRVTKIELGTRKKQL